MCQAFILMDLLKNVYWKRIHAISAAEQIAYSPGIYYTTMKFIGHSSPFLKGVPLFIFFLKNKKTAVKNSRLAVMEAKSL
jgi:hypothetical protein